MAQFSEQEQNAMRRDAARRAQEMQRRVHPTASPGDGCRRSLQIIRRKRLHLSRNRHQSRSRRNCRFWGICRSSIPADFCPIWMATPC